MKLIRQLLAFLVYSNLFIAACAVLMVNQTTQLLLGNKPDTDLTGFVFFSTLCSYSFHYYLSTQSVIPSERIKWAARYRFIYVIIFFIGLAGVVFFGYALLSYWPWLLIAAVATFLYSAPKIPHPLFIALRKVAIGKTIFLAFIWMYVTTVLPLVISRADWETNFTLFVISRFFLIYAICILFDYRDRQDDKAAGVRSLITYLGENSIRFLFYFSLLVFGISTCWMLYGNRLVTILILLVPGIILAFSYNYARRNFSDLFYYFFLDGLMALSAVIMLIPGVMDV